MSVCWTGLGSVSIHSLLKDGMCKCGTAAPSTSISVIIKRARCENSVKIVGYKLHREGGGEGGNGREGKTPAGYTLVP